MFLALLIGTVVVSTLAVHYVKRWALAHGILDEPNARSSHTLPTPRVGGIGMVATFYAGCLVAAVIQGGLDTRVWAVLAGGLLVAAVGLVDDLRRLPARTRFAVHLVAAIGAVVAGVRVETISLEPLGTVQLGLAGALLSVLWLVAMTNIYNFMDGIDGIAAGVAVAIAFGIVIVGIPELNSTKLLVALCLMGSARGFLVHNSSPASVFMGDVGSGFLGFVLGGLALITSHGTGGSLAVFAAFAPFVLDATLTLTRRVLRGERWYEAHRSHYYQRLVILGYSHRKVSWIYYMFSTIPLVGAAAYDWRANALGLGLLVGCSALFLVVPIFVTWLEARQPRPAVGHG